MSACDRPVQVVEKTSRTARIENSVNVFLTHFQLLVKLLEQKTGVQQMGKKGDSSYVRSQRVHKRSGRVERGSGRDARTRRMVIG